MQPLKTITYYTWVQSGSNTIAVAGDTVTINSDQADDLVSIGKAIYAGQSLPGSENIPILNPPLISELPKFTWAQLQALNPATWANKQVFVSDLNSVWFSNGVSFIKNSYDPRLPKFQHSLSQSRSGVRNAKILCIGDSETSGYFANGNNFAGCRPLGYPNMLAGLINTANMPAYVGNSFGDSTIGNDSTFQAFDSRWVYSGSFTHGGVSSLGGTTVGLAGAGSGSATFSPVQPFDTVDIYYIQNTTYGSFDVQFDGEKTGATISSAGALSIMKTTRSVSSVGEHILNFVITNQNLIIGISTYDSTKKGVEVINAGRGSAKVGDIAANTNIWDVANSTAGGILATVAPDLTIIGLGVNDWIAGTVPATYAASLQTLIAAAKLYGDVILTTEAPQNSVNTAIATQLGIIQQVRTVALNNGIPLVDTYALFGDYLFAKNTLSYYASTEPTHPNQAGYTAQAKAIIDVIGGI